MKQALTQTLAQAQTQNEMKVVIHEIKFFLWNFLDQDDNKRKNLFVHVLAQDYEKNGRYSIRVYETKDYCTEFSGEPLLELTINSRGFDLKQNVHSTYIGKEVYNILFKKKDKGIIRGYMIRQFRGTAIDNLRYSEMEQPVFVVHEVSMAIVNYPIKKGKTTDIFVHTCIDLDCVGEHDWYYLHVFECVDENHLSTLLLDSKSTATERRSYSKERGGRLTKLDKEVMNILKDYEVQGIIRPL